MSTFLHWFETESSAWGIAAFKVIAIVAGTLILWAILRVTLGALNQRLMRRKSEDARKARTTVAAVRIALGILIYTLAGFMILTEMGVQLGPILATAGVAGIALGLGAQSLVKDGMNGFFLMMENRIRVGDVIEAAGKEGTVEAITLLDLVLRDLRGRVHIIPHGTVDVATNQTLQYSVAMVEVGTSYNDDPRRVMAILKQVADTMCEEAEWQRIVTEEPQVFGITSFGDSSLNYRVRVRTESAEHWAVERELRIRIKERFDAEGIEIPYPHRTLYWGAGQAPEETSNR